jgi:Mg2+-importing ATPase
MDTSAYQGLTNDEVVIRQNNFGPNILVTGKKQSAFFIFLQEFKNPLVLVLLAAAIIALATGATASGALIVGIVVVSSVLDFTISYKSQKAAQALAKRVSPRATVIRNGQSITVLHEAIVPGDIVTLSAGSVIPADGTIVVSGTLYLNEAALTGESLPVEKKVTDTVYMGSGVVSGDGVMEVVTIGRETKFATIALMLTQKERPSEFERGIRHFSLLLTRVIIILVVCIFLINAYLKHDILSSLIFSLALAVGLTPDLLPVIIAVNLSRASIRMSKKGVIVKKLSAIENFGSMDILCTDKTGTLTEGTIVLVKYLDGAGTTSENVLEVAYVSSMLKGGAMTPLDRAIIAREIPTIKTYHKIDEIPFDFERRRDTMIVAREGMAPLLITKGAPEAVLGACTISVSEKKVAEQLFETLSQEGYRVIAVATTECSVQKKYSILDEQHLSFIGFIAFVDPPKKDIKHILEELRDRSIEIKVITGDHRLVAEHTVREVGLLSKGTLDAVDIDAMSDQELSVRVEETTIFSRVTPIQKNRIIQTLQSIGHTVGYMGDGINDAPALRSADVGISVDNALDVAKESADIVLTTKDLEYLIQGVKEGRKTFANTQKYISMSVSSNFGNMISMTGASLVLPFLPMLPTQILLNNLLYETAQVALIADHVDEHILNKPHPWDIKALKRFMIVFGLLSSCFDFLVFYVLYRMFGLGPSQFQTAWFMQSFFSQVFAVFFIRTAHAVWKAQRPHRAVIMAACATTFVAWGIALSQFGIYFGFTSVPGFIIGTILGISAVYFISIEIVKFFFFHKQRAPRIAKKTWLDMAK